MSKVYREKWFIQVILCLTHMQARTQKHITFINVDKFIEIY